MKHLIGEATPSETEQVMQWLAADASNQGYYNQLKQVWDTSRQLASVSAADENKAWERFQQRTREPKENKTLLRTVRYGWMKVAASIILVIGLGLMGYWLINNNKPVKEMLVETQQAVLKDTLPDGSVVTVNKRSSISYPSRFTRDARKITLKGEAFFDVTPDKKKPFIISVNDVQVTVVGTSFNVKSINGNTEVIVETGVVSVTKAGQTVELNAGEKLLAEEKDSVLAKEKVSDKLYNYYRSKEFVCDDTPLWKLAEVLNDAYNVSIVIGRPELRDLRMNTTFNNESLDQVLNVISLTFSIKVTKEGDKIILQ
ncbi:MAG TPA: FecR domain-containing protein [Chitinophagaceae bacterium]